MERSGFASHRGTKSVSPSSRITTTMISGLTISADIRFDDVNVIPECRYHIMSADIVAMSPCYQGELTTDALKLTAANTGGSTNWSYGGHLP